jgi:hypothetical protein
VPASDIDDNADLTACISGVYGPPLIDAFQHRAICPTTSARC